MTLMNLQASTLPSQPQNSNFDETYVSHSDEAEAELISKSGSFVSLGEDLTYDDDGVRTY
jgi:hypothetical protein